jgi:hypothetical protein
MSFNEVGLSLGAKRLSSRAMLGVTYGRQEIYLGGPRSLVVLRSAARTNTGKVLGPAVHDVPQMHL